MHFEQLDLNLLVALDALLTERSITAAGVRVHLTQSAMSGALSRLREFFNDELLTQVGRKMVPTPLGESLAEPVRQILLQVKAAINAKPGFDPATSVVWNENPLIGDSLTQEQYLGLGHVVLQFGCGRVPVQDEWFLTKLGVTRRIEVLAMNFNSVPQHIVGTRRIATIHRRLAEYYARYLPLRILAPPYDLPLLTEAVQWHSLFTEDAGNRWLRTLLKHAASDVRDAR
jgi:DNA-binding transcriptional LysR family regulator